MRTEVYSWRVSKELKSDLEREARLRKRPISSVLESAVREWLSKSRDIEDDEEQRRLHLAAAECFGTITGGNPHRAETARRTIRERLARKYGR